MTTTRTVPMRTNAVLAVLFAGAFVMGCAEVLVVGMIDLIAADLAVSLADAGALVVLVQRFARAANTIVVEQRRRVAGVLAQHLVSRGQRLQRPNGDVLEVSDRGGDDIEPGRQGLGGELGASDEKSPWPLVHTCPDR